MVSILASHSVIFQWNFSLLSSVCTKVELWTLKEVNLFEIFMWMHQKSPYTFTSFQLGLTLSTNLIIFPTFKLKSVWARSLKVEHKYFSFMSVSLSVSQTRLIFFTLVFNVLISSFVCLAWFWLLQQYPANGQSFILFLHAVTSQGSVYMRHLRCHMT